MTTASKKTTAAQQKLAADTAQIQTMQNVIARADTVEEREQAQDDLARFIFSD